MTISACCNRYWMAMDGLQEEILQILGDMEWQFIVWETDRLWRGLNADNEIIVPEYAESTIKTKKRKSLPYDRVILYDTGMFYQSIFAKVEGNELVIDTPWEDVKYLKKKYGERIFGLTEEEKSKSNVMTADAMCVYVKQIVGL